MLPWTGAEDVPAAESMETGLNLKVLDGSKIRLLKRWRVTALVSAVLTVALSAPAAVAAIGTIEAHVVKLRNDHGQVMCTLFSPSDKFPEESRGGMTIAVPIKNRQAICKFKNVPYGNYAIVAFHDENLDGKFNQNWLGLPQEGFGFSDNPGTLRKPTFNDAKFTIGQPLVQVTIELNYWF
jgi:uncharacterized protein (DUF2141 family)